MAAQRAISAAHRILLVEDVPAYAELVEYELRRAGVGATTRRVDTEADFVRALREFKPDLILSDHSLPAFRASEALQLAERVAPGVPVIIVTGSLDEETAADYIKAGAADYIVKHHLERLGSAVLRALALKHAHEERARAQEQLRQSEERFRTLIEGVDDAADGASGASDYYRVTASVSWSQAGMTDSLYLVTVILQP